MFQVGHWYVTIWPVPSSECWLPCHWRRGCGSVAILCCSEPLTGAINYQLVAVINLMTRNLILTASELASAESTPFLRCESSNLSTFFCQAMYHLWYDIQWIERCVLSWGWTVAHFDNRLCHLRENIGSGVENAESLVLNAPSNLSENASLKRFELSSILSIFI